MDKQNSLTKRKASKVPQGKSKAKPSKNSAENTSASQEMQPEVLRDRPPLPTEPDVILKSPPTSRSNSKLSKVVEMLRAPEGASIADIMKATDW